MVEPRSLSAKRLAGLNQFLPRLHFSSYRRPGLCVLGIDPYLLDICPREGTPSGKSEAGGKACARFIGNTSVRK
jgi:hypothetical protein